MERLYIWIDADGPKQDGPEALAKNRRRGGRPIMLRLAQGTLTLSESYPMSAAGGSQTPGGDDGGRSNTAIITKTKPRTKRPNLYRVLLLNDDYTPMEFVVHVLERFFNKNREDATRIMLHVHQNGVGECGVFTYEIAETKVTQVMDFARKHQHPLQCVMEKN
jgi:ATP-dependent Clp protease adaptor protein ClpS